MQQNLYCYYISVDNATAEQAQVECQKNFADLLFVDDDGENVILFDNGPALTLDSYWIGYEQVFKSIWRWGSTGKAGSYRKWDIGEPDGEGGCARMTPYIQGVWRDWDCNRKLPYICKKFADCGPPELMPLSTYTLNPVTEITNTTVVPRGTKVTYTCTNGNEYADESLSKTALCSVGGIWVPNIPQDDPCQPKQCIPPPAYGERTVSNGSALTVAFGTVVSYECATGYWFDQYSEGVIKYLECALDKTWQGDEINECTKVYCVRPVTSNARADTPLNSFGTVATYACDEGFEYSDNSTIKTFTCLADGWDPKPTPCMELLCPEYRVSNAVPSTDSRSVFTDVIWTCVPGMRYPDTTTRKSMSCELDQTWSNRILKGCERKKCLGTPPNASETYTHDYNATDGKTFRFGDAINYTCSLPDWVFVDGPNVRQVLCNEDGEWTPQTIPDCVGEVIEVKHGVTHKPAESEGSATFGTVTFLILGIILGVVVFLDVATIGKHIAVMKENIFGNKKETEKSDPVEHLDGDAVAEV
ncbi:zona pellucida sperm-binding protein 3 receptor-like [Watersipora subatra]|uniref:zona pellucida sperm-binding protein 3 receptor-like n=1 Tax=Watersipora subatra TaxID=2589382 RepID=UPI00355C1C4A